MLGYVGDIDWMNAEAMKYWSYPKNYAKDSKTEIKNYILSGDYVGSLKVDGYYQRLVKDENGNCFMIARNKDVNGHAINKYEWVPQLHPFMNSLPNGTVLLCECFLPNDEGSKKITTLLGCLKDKCIERQKNGRELYFYIFDVCAFNGVNYVDSPIKERIKILRKLAEDRVYSSCKYIKWAEYFDGAELWNKMCEYLEDGREGVVIYRKDCPIYFKRTPARMTIKVKKEISNTIDCFFTGRTNPPTREYTGTDIVNWKFWQNDMTGEKLLGELYLDYTKGKPYVPITKSYYNDWAGSLEIGVLDGDKIIPIGNLSGLTDEIKGNAAAYKFKPIEVSCMEIFSDTHRLRHPKFIQFREDLTIQDCTYEKAFGEHYNVNK